MRRLSHYPLGEKETKEEKTKMTNWDEINAKKQKAITLGQAMNLAADYSGLTEEMYKHKTRQFFKWMTELQEELL